MLALASADVSVTYDAPPPCPDRTEFEARVRARVHVDPAPRSGKRAERLEVQVRVSTDGATGRLIIRTSTGRTRTREIEAATCDEAVDALALVAALALENLQAEMSARDAADPAAMPSRTGDRDLAQGRASAAASHVLPLAMGFSTTGFALSGPAPRVLPGLGLAGSVAYLPVKLALHAGVRLAPHLTFETAEGNATFSWRAGTIHLCANLLSLTRTASLEPCLGLELGVLRAAGSQTDRPTSTERFWTALGPGLAGHWKFLPPLAVQIFAEALFPGTRDRFLLGSTVVHEVPVFAVRAGGGLGVRFW